MFTPMISLLYKHSVVDWLLIDCRYFTSLYLYSMLMFNAIIGIATIICSTTLDAHAQARSAPHPCMTNICLLRRIATLEANVTDFTKQLDSANRRLDIDHQEARHRERAIGCANL